MVVTFSKTTEKSGALNPKDVKSVEHRRRIKTEEKPKVVAVEWGTYLNAALTI